MVEAPGSGSAGHNRPAPPPSNGSDATEPPLLDAEDIRSLQRLSLDSRETLLAGLGGQREGPGRSAGFEFVDYRHYTPGDDSRRIDWNIYARLRELYVRASPQEARVWLDILLDASRSMDFGEPNKLYYGRRLAALLGAVALIGTDAVHVHTLSDGRAASGRLLDTAGLLAVLVDELMRLPVGRTTSLASSVRAARDAGGQPELAVLISDALVAAEDLGLALHELNRDARAAALLHVVSASDDEGGAPGAVQLVDRETGRRIQTLITQEVSERFAEQALAFRARIEQQCRANGVRYIEASTPVDPRELLSRIAREETLVRADRGR
jgi:uncharacterized protein (DUF58 family)